MIDELLRCYILNTVDSKIRTAKIHDFQVARNSSSDCCFFIVSSYQNMVLHSANSLAVILYLY